MTAPEGSGLFWGTWQRETWNGFILKVSFWWHRHKQLCSWHYWQYSSCSRQQQTGLRLIHKHYFTQLCVGPLVINFYLPSVCVQHRRVLTVIL
jgi:hypothetical protein